MNEFQDWNSILERKHMRKCEFVGNWTDSDNSTMEMLANTFGCQVQARSFRLLISVFLYVSENSTSNYIGSNSWDV